MGCILFTSLQSFSDRRVLEESGFFCGLMPRVWGACMSTQGPTTLPVTKLTLRFSVLAKVRVSFDSETLDPNPKP